MINVIKNDKNTLRYHHDKSCKGLPIDRHSLPVKHRIKKEESIEPKLEAKKQPTYHDKLNERILKKKESFSKLAFQIA